MATIAVIPSDVPSKRMLARRLAERLADAGHRVVLLVTTERPDDPGFERRTVPLRHNGGDDQLGRRPLARWQAARRAAEELDPMTLADELAAVEADLVIVDIEEYEAEIVALALGVERLAILCSFFEVWPIAGVGPNDGGPRGGRIGHIRAASAWRLLWIRMRLHDAKRALTGSGIDRIVVARRLARRLEVRDRLTARQWLHPFAPRDLPLLVCNALEFDVPHEPRAGVSHIGPLLPAIEVLAEAGDEAMSTAVDAAVREERPVVVCSFGTVVLQTQIADRLTEVARCRPDRLFVVATTDREWSGELRRLPNVVAREWLPLRVILSAASAAVVHSGNATMHECIAAGVPMVVYPFPTNDQPRNAARVRRHGVGEVGDVRNDTAADIAARLDRVLGDDEMRHRIARLTPLVTRYESDQIAVRTVESLLPRDAHDVTGDGRTQP